MSVQSEREPTIGIARTGCRSRAGEARLRQVLAGARFPADRWELVACAEHYGADATTMRELRGLPARRFTAIDQVLRLVGHPAGADLHRDWVRYQLP